VAAGINEIRRRNPHRRLNLDDTDGREIGLESCYDLCTDDAALSETEEGLPIDIEL
jgi:hypothetical protein